MTARGLRAGTVGGSDGPTVRDAVFALLRAHGLTTIFGNPGSTELPMFADMPGDFRYVLGLQESVVVAMADGFAQASGVAALVNLHSSAGVGHALGSLFTACRNNSPLVITAGQQARSILPYEPFLYAERATEFPRPFVKWSCEPARAEDVPLAIARAYHIAMQAPCGPTFVSVPVDDWDRPCAAVAPRRVSRSTMPDPALIDEAAAMLAKARNPVIVAGAGVAASDARAVLRDLAQRHAAPVWAAPMAARNVFAEDHPLFAGFLVAAREAIVESLAGHDLILVVGAPVFTFHVEGSGPLLPDGAALVQLVDDPIVASRTPLGLAITGNVEAGLRQLLTAMPVSPRAVSAPRAIPSPPPADRLTDALLMARLDALRPRGLAIVEEAPSTRGPLHDLFPIRDGDEFHTCASGGLGHGLPASIGVALARPDRTTLCLLGDGSAMYAIQGLWSAAEVSADVRFVVVNNGGYAALDQFAALFGIAAMGSKVAGLDFVGLAAAQGVPGERVADPGALDSAIERLFDGPGPRLLEVIVSG